MVYSSEGVFRKWLLIIFALGVSTLGYVFSDQIGTYVGQVKSYLTQVTSSSVSVQEELNKAILKEFEVTADVSKAKGVFFSKDELYFIPKKNAAIDLSGLKAYISKYGDLQTLEKNGLVVSIPYLRKTLENIFDFPPQLAQGIPEPLEGVNQLLKNLNIPIFVGTTVPAGLDIAAKDMLLAIFYDKTDFFGLSGLQINMKQLEQFLNSVGIFANADRIKSLLTKTFGQSVALIPFTNDILSILAGHQLASNYEQPAQRSETTKRLLEALFKHLP